MHEPPLILIVDDDPQLSDLFSTKLAAAGFAVKKAFNGKEGYEAARSQKPDLIILDLKMPVWDGAETLAKLHEDEETKDIKVVILSSFNDWSAIKMDKAAAEALGAIDFLEKGIDLNELVARCRSILNYRKAL